MNTSKTISAALFFSLLVPVYGQELRQPEPMGDYALELDLQQDRLKVSGGSPFNMCALLLGFEETEFVLPGNALLSVQALVVLPLGEYDAQGEFELDLRPYADQIAKAKMFLIQAISLVNDSGFFATSNVHSLGIATMIPRTGEVDTEPTEEDEIDTQPVDGAPDAKPIDNEVETVDTK